MFVLLTVSWVSLASSLDANSNGNKGPVIPKGKGEQCVAETNFMRRNHMDLIVHQRDETVIRGIRDEPFSLVECVDCHVQFDKQNDPIRVDAKDQFCSSCHEFVATKIDCFSCHAAVPDGQGHDTAFIQEGSPVNRESSLDSASTNNWKKNANEHWMPNQQLLVFSSKKNLPDSVIRLTGKIGDDSADRAGLENDVSNTNHAIINKTN